jgi:CubicO group peptidase (beta-lactamase class C family)
MHYAGFGVTSLTNPLPVTPNTLFQCGSISKTFVGTAMMALAERGLVALDAPIRRYLPGFRVRDAQASERSTVRTLLTHTGGWLGDHFNDFGFGDDALARIVDEMATLPQETPLGAQWSYNNIGFAAAGRVMEVVTGLPFEAVIKRHVFDPLGLADSLYMPSEVMLRRFAAGHNIENGKHVVATPWEIGRANHPAGGVTTTVIDLLRYARGHIDAGLIDNNSNTKSNARLLTRRAALAMREPQIASTSRYRQGVTWWLGELASPKRELMLQHGGATNGQGAQLRIVPARGFAIAMLVNSDTASMLYDPISRLAFSQYLGATLDVVKPRKAAQSADLREFAGTYLGYLSNVAVKLERGGLALRSTALGRFPTPTSPVHGDALGPKVQLAFYARDRVFAADNPADGARGEFIRGGDGRVTMLRWGGRLRARRG